jgi:hypothetical protein
MDHVVAMGGVKSVSYFASDLQRVIDGKLFFAVQAIPQ